MEGGRIEGALKNLDSMLLTLWHAGFVTLVPEPPPPGEEANTLEQQKADQSSQHAGLGRVISLLGPEKEKKPEPVRPVYRPEWARPTDKLALLKQFRSVNPLYGLFLVGQLGIADRAERMQAFESVLELPGSVAHFVRVPSREQMPPGPLAMTRLDEQLLTLGLATAQELTGEQADDAPREDFDDGRRVWAIKLAEKLRRLFDFECPGVRDVHTQPVWAGGEVLEFGGDFQKYVTSKGLQKQEGMVFRHLLRLVLLLGEFASIAPADTDPAEWKADLDDMAEKLTACCLAVDSAGVERALELGRAEGALTEVSAAGR
jgi:hypothetical protein